jgi:hypothetical protein
MNLEATIQSAVAQAVSVLYQFETEPAQIQLQKKERI